MILLLLLLWNLSNIRKWVLNIIENWSSLLLVLNRLLLEILLLWLLLEILLLWLLLLY